MKRKVIIACLIAAMTFGVFSGCDNKITEQSTFGNASGLPEMHRASI